MTYYKIYNIVQKYTCINLIAIWTKMTTIHKTRLQAE